MEDKLLSSTLKNYRKKEIDTLQEYLIQISNLKDKPEVLLYNFARFIRTQELTKFLVFDLGAHSRICTKSPILNLLFSS